MIDGNDITYLLCVYCISPSGGLQPEPYKAFLAVIDSNYRSKIRPKDAFLFHCFPGQQPMTVNSTPDGFVVIRCRFGAGATEVDFYQGADIHERSDIHERPYFYNYIYSPENVKPAHSFKISLWDKFLTTVTNKYQLVAAKKFGYHVRVYEKDGQLIREFELYGGKCESCVSIAFNYLTEELVCVSHVGSWFYLSTYKLQTGVRRHKARLTLFGECSRFDPMHSRYPRLTAHCNGPMAVVSEKYALRLQ